MEYKKDLEKLNNLDRDKYFNVYLELGNKMFSECITPTVYDFVNIEDEKSRSKIEHISKYTKNTEDILQSIKRREPQGSQEESDKLMNSVIAANITDITESGYFYKKLISSCDNMDITQNDCRSSGEKISLPVDEVTYNYKIKFRFITEINSYTESYKEFIKETKDLESIHVRTFLTCKTDPKHRCFCKKCAGIYKRSKEDTFVPRNIGVYSTLMITEHATQGALDSMNKGLMEKVNSILETKLDKKDFPDYKAVKKKIEEIIDKIGYVGVQSRYYEIALLSRFFLDGNGTSFTPSSLQTSFLKQGDKLGNFIYRPTEKNFVALLSSKHIDAKSKKSRLMVDSYEN